MTRAGVDDAIIAARAAPIPRSDPMPASAESAPFTIGDLAALATIAATLDPPGNVSRIAERCGHSVQRVHHRIARLRTIGWLRADPRLPVATTARGRAAIGHWRALRALAGADA